MPHARHLLASLLTTAAMAGALSGANPGTILFQDSFTDKLADGWSWEREDRANWRVGPAGLEVRVQPGNMWGGANNAKNVLLHPLPAPTSEPVEISVTLSNRPTAQWEQANLVWFYDDSNMVKLNMELVSGRFTIVMGREENDRARTIAIVPLDDYAVELRLQAVSNRIRGQFRTRHWSDWREVGECDLPVKGDPKASLHFYNGPANEAHWVSARQFTVRRLPAGSADWPQPRIAEKICRNTDAGAMPTEPATLALENGLTLSVDPTRMKDAAKANGEARIFRRQDGRCGWDWNRRSSGSRQPLLAGIGLGKVPGHKEGAALPEIDLQTPLAMELDAVTRLGNDHGDHTLAAHIWLEPPGKPGLHQVAILFDWYGPEAAGASMPNEGRAYIVPQANQDAPVKYAYRIQGLRGAPPKVDLQRFLQDARQRGLPPTAKVVGLWFGNEVWDGSVGGTLVTRLDFLINGRRVAGLAK